MSKNLVSSLHTATPYNLQIWKSDFQKDIVQIQVQLRGQEIKPDGQPEIHKMIFVCEFGDIEKIVKSDSIKFLKKATVGQHENFSGKIININSIHDVITELEKENKKKEERMIQEKDNSTQTETQQNNEEIIEPNIENKKTTGKRK